MADILFEDLFDMGRKARAIDPALHLSPDQYAIYAKAMQRLINEEPVQYVTGRAYFFRRQYHVTPAVLIPRPETEELVLHSLHILKKKQPVTNRILDIGSGSGCIAISLALEGSHEVNACDISSEALSVAQGNAHAHQAKVNFFQMDILSAQPSGKFDLIVSNPPYIPLQEKSSMAGNVTRYEPSLALFVADEDPLIFYDRIGQIGTETLSKGGHLLFEVHEGYATEVADLLGTLGYLDVIVIRDLFDKPRIVQAVWTD